MRIQIKLFGPEAAAAGTRVVPLDIPGEQATPRAIRHVALQRYPQLREQLTACRFAVNHEFVSDDFSIHETDEVALIGRVSGG